MNLAGRVAPHAGAWIETLLTGQQPAIMGSRPTRARGLKQGCGKTCDTMDAVAPHAGAWIETMSRDTRRLGTKSRPTRARGLKHFYGQRILMSSAGRAPRGRVD